MTAKSLSNPAGFTYLDAPQGGEEWVKKRIGRITASELHRWMAVGVKGQPLQKRKDYERELAYERQFNRPFSHFVTSAMEEGRYMETHLRNWYSDIVGVAVETVWCWFNEWFVASPDGLVGDKGLVEFKWVYDTTFSETLYTGIKNEHYIQIQGQLWATGREWCDYVVGNGNTGYMKVIRVERDEELIAQFAEKVKELDQIDESISSDNLFDIRDRLAAAQASSLIEVEAVRAALTEFF